MWSGISETGKNRIEQKHHMVHVQFVIFMDHRVWDTWWGIRILAGFLIQMSTEEFVETIRMNEPDQKGTCLMGKELGLSSGEDRHLGGEVRNQGKQQWLRKNAQGGREKTKRGQTLRSQERGNFPAERYESQGQTLLPSLRVLEQGHRICRLGSHEWPLPGVEMTKHEWPVTTEGGKGTIETEESTRESWLHLRH